MTCHWTKHQLSIKKEAEILQDIVTEFLQPPNHSTLIWKLSKMKLALFINASLVLVSLSWAMEDKEDVGGNVSG